MCQEPRSTGDACLGKAMPTCIKQIGGTETFPYYTFTAFLSLVELAVEQHHKHIFISWLDACRSAVDQQVPHGRAVQMPFTPVPRPLLPHRFRRLREGATCSQQGQLSALSLEEHALSTSPALCLGSLCAQCWDSPSGN